ncbi:alpha-glucosidase [Pseudomonas paralcaligenes]|uniref:alpha-glucosidase n=1 Tax=Pseudomonas paralcaligenes TaxID=2772558 RepID=UPI001C81AAE9|nr:alpha-glucosidase [Pseudomonas paralcaligenes]
MLLGLAGIAAFAAWSGWQAWQQRAIRAELEVAPALDSARQFALGANRLEWDGRSLRLLAGHRVLWATDGGFLAAGRGHEEVEEHRGAMFVEERRELLCQRQRLDAIEPRDGRLLLRGVLGCADDSESGYVLILEDDGERGVRLAVALDDERLNRLYLDWRREPDERFHGFGEQFSAFDLAGRRVPILVQEQGVGRGLEPITSAANLTARAGGDWWTTYAPVPHYLSSAGRSFFSESGAYQVFDLRDAHRVQLEVHEGRLAARIYTAADAPGQIAQHTAVVGRMPPLPDWTQRGTIVGLQGGTERVRGILRQLDEAGVPLAGVWLQDWVGQRSTSFGKQLWWNWSLDERHYPGWAALNGELQARGVRSLAYVNPFLVDMAGQPDAVRNLYAEARERGYLLRDATGQPLSLLNTSFSAGMLDLSNPEARQWLKRVLREEMLAKGFSGWMADFGEALPYEARLASGEPAALAHNRYPEEWARLNRELLEEAGGQGELFFFMRSAFSRSPGLTTSLWAGDQLVTWDAHDGLHSALLGMLSGGLSGFALNHSDTGGYTTISHPLKDYHRDDELLSRWMEFSAFTSLLRSHEGNRPDANRQVYSSPELLARFARSAKIFAALAPYRQQLMEEAARSGMPLMRPLWLHYPDDPAGQQALPRSFMLGDQLLVAPVLEPGVSELEVLLPAGDWVHLWSGRTLRARAGELVKVPVPLGQPAVFYPEGAALAASLAKLRDIR